MNNIDKYLTNQHLFTKEVSGIRFSHKINDRISEEFYKGLKFKKGRKFVQHLVWYNGNGNGFQIEGIIIYVTHIKHE